MRFFTFVASAAFVVIGIFMIVAGGPLGWAVAGFFAMCLIVAVFEPRLPKPWLSSGFRLVITEDEIGCEHPRRKRESILWRDVARIWYVTTPYGPHSPDEWILLEGEAGGCSFPTEAHGFDRVWVELEKRFPGFDYGPIIQRPEGKHLCWEKRAA